MVGREDVEDPRVAVEGGGSERAESTSIESDGGPKDCEDPGNQLEMKLSQERCKAGDDGRGMFWRAREVKINVGTSGSVWNPPHGSLIRRMYCNTE